MSHAEPDVPARFAALARSGALELPDPGAGATAERHLGLFDLARREPVSVARLAEAHTDAIAILREAGNEPVPDALYGVWASVAADGDVTLVYEGTTWAGELLLHGDKPFASGLGVVDRALLTARCGDGDVVLVDVDVGESRSVRHDLTTWTTRALAGSRTGSVRFCGHPIAADRSIGEAGWYLDRAGFWHGACGPAACWAGAAVGLVDRADALADGDPHRRAHLGAMRADGWALRQLVIRAGDEIDDDRSDAARARARALSLRYCVERLASEILDRFGQAFGPRPFVSDVDIEQRWIDTHLYLRQQHAERDLAVLGGGS